MGTTGRIASSLTVLSVVFVAASCAAETAPENPEFARRSSAPGVFYANSFDSPGQIAPGIFPDGNFQKSGSGFDGTESASGAGSLRFVIPSESGSSASGSWRVNFADEFETGQVRDIYVQWRQRFDPVMLETIFENSGGFKQAILGEGLVPGQSEYSCTDSEIVVQNTRQRGFVQLYHSCGRYLPFEEPYGSTDFKMQNGRPAPFCLYSRYSKGGGACFRYVANEWMTFQLHVSPGPVGEATNPLTGKVERGYAGSVVQLWVAREGQASELVHDWDGLVLTLTEVPPYGKLWLLPYQTEKSPVQKHPVTYTWYDDLIISTQRIADPGHEVAGDQAR